MDPKRNTPRHIIIKLPKMKDKERILKAARGKETVTYKRVSIRPLADFSKEALQARRGWKEVLYFLNYKTHFPSPEIWEENGGVSYSPNVAYLACWVGGAVVELVFLL